MVLEVMVLGFKNTGWNHIILFMVTQRNEDETNWDQYFMFLFLNLTNVGGGGGGAEGGESVGMGECGKIKISLSKPKLEKILPNYNKV